MRKKSRAKAVETDPIASVGRFVVWATPTLAYLCDPNVTLEHGCRVVWVENRFLCGVGTLQTKAPDRAKGLSVEFEGEGYQNPVRNLNKTDVVRVIGIYEGVHEAGCLEPGHGSESSTHLLRPALGGDGTPLVTAKPLPAMRSY